MEKNRETIFKKVMTALEEIGDKKQKNEVKYYQMGYDNPNINILIIPQYVNRKIFGGAVLIGLNPDICGVCSIYNNHSEYDKCLYLSFFEDNTKKLREKYKDWITSNDRMPGKKYFSPYMIEIHFKSLSLKYSLVATTINSFYYQSLFGLTGIIKRIYDDFCAKEFKYQRSVEQLSDILEEYGKKTKC